MVYEWDDLEPRGNPSFSSNWLSPIPFDRIASPHANAL
jgi:hypothetical protein